jgi:alkylresorcinol/alkylpyrone synthase
MHMPQILSIGTALPEYVVNQDDVMAVLDAARDRPMPPRMAEILRNSGIEQRYLAMPPGYYLGERGWADRAATYNAVSERLFRDAAEKALAEASLNAADIGQIVFVSTTGTMTPTLPSRMIIEMNFAPDARALPLFGYGCAGGVLGLSLAADLFRVDPAKPVLLVCLELCSMAYDHRQIGKKDMIALALFADGCAAAIVGAGEGPELTASASHVWANTIDMMGWEIGDTGFDLVLSRDIPAFVRSDFAPVVDAFLDTQGLSVASMAEPACHPGGGRVVDALADYFNSDLPATRATLARHGNMSSPTVLFVLKALMDAGPLAGPTLLTALGPGFTGALALLRP